jgi:hypothetical protein
MDSKVECRECGKSRADCSDLFDAYSVTCCDSCNHPVPQIATAKLFEDVETYFDLHMPKVGSQSYELLHLFVSAGERGVTDYDLVERGHQLGRRVDLMDKGWIVNSREDRRNPNGHLGIIWVLSVAALKYLQSVAA